MIVDAYRSQMEDQGGERAGVDVRIEGEPDFDQNAPTEFDGLKFDISAGGARCEVADDAVVASPDHPSAEKQ